MKLSKLQKGRVPLERALSKLGLASRVEANSLIVNGQVKVHGVLEVNPKRMVNPDTAHIEILGKKAVREETVLLLFHKPKGVLTTKRDPEGRKTIYDVLPAQFHHLHAVGRLDLHTSGLLLMTNDTRLSHFLTNPENAIPRTYLVLVEGEFTQETQAVALKGVMDRDQLLKPIELHILKKSRKETLIKMTLNEGKNREIRRLCLALQHEVLSLKRIQFGEHSLGDLPVGQFKIVNL